MPVQLPERCYTDETWARSGDIHFVIDHINLSLGRRLGEFLGGTNVSQDVLTVDFLPQQDLRNQKVRSAAENTVVAMYMNNRAAEALARGRVNDAYWWSREAVVQDPCLRARLQHARRRLPPPRRPGGGRARAGPRDVPGSVEPADHGQPGTGVWRPGARRGGRRAPGSGWRCCEPDPPFAFFYRGQEALRNGDYAAARDLFAREVARAPYYHEFHYWLALAYAELGDVKGVRKHLGQAMESSTTRGDQDLYAAKLDQIRSMRAR